MSRPRRLSGAARGDAAALFAGCLTPLGFAPFNLFALALVAPALLFFVWRDAGAGRAAWRGFLYGLGFFGIGVSWVYVSLHDFGFMPVPLAALATLLFVAGLALYPALLGVVQARLAALPAALHLAVALPAGWVLTEWLRGWFLTGFPWLNLGYSQSDSVLVGYASALGVYGVSLATAISAGLLAAMGRDRARAVRVYAPVLLLVWLGGWALGQIEWVAPHGAPLRVALVQGNVPLSQKWQPAYRQTIVDRYVHLSEQAGKVDLIVWPEAALPGLLEQFGPGVMARLESVSRAQGAELVLGVVERDGAKGEYYNSVLRVGATPAWYRKQHLVPFGEFLPWPAVFRGLIRYLQIPMSDFAAGDAAQAPFVAAGHTLGVSVCYEDAFGEEVIRALPAATLLVNVSEDAWFGHSLAPHQRIQMARLRAIESGRPLVRAANTGPSVAIDHRGRIDARSPQFEPYVLVATVQPMQGVTPYARGGNAPLVLIAFVLCGATIIALWRRGMRRSVRDSGTAA